MLPAGFYLIYLIQASHKKASQIIMSSSQALLINSIQQLVYLLHRYLSADQEDDLRVRVPWNLTHADSVQEILYREKCDKPTESYDPERRILAVKASDEHSSRHVFGVIHNFLLEGCCTGFLRE